MTTLRATLHDGSSIPVLVRGTGPAVLLSVRFEPFDETTATTMRAWGADPDIGPTLVAGLGARFTVVAADYEGHRMANPAALTLTAAAVAADLLAIADAAGVERFAWYGYSWLALAGLQLAIRSDRLWALAMGGFPPLDGPYAEMLAVTRAAHAMALAPQPATVAAEVEPGDWDAVGVQADPAQTGQFVTLYESLAGFDDRAALGLVTVPRLAFAGASDAIEYGPAWGGTTVRIAEPLVRDRDDLVAAGWEVRVLPGLDHMSAMAGAVALPLLRDWLAGVAPAG